MTNEAATNRHGSATITLPSDTELLITRVFDAPAELIFEAWTTPDLVRRWWGYDTVEWVVCDVDLRLGGTWRWVFRHGELEVGFHGAYREIDRPRRLAYTEVFEGFPGGDENGALNIVTLDEVGGVTTMTTLVQHVLAEHRDAHVASGMEAGMQISYDRLEDLVR